MMEKLSKRSTSMKCKAEWYERYVLSISEELTVKEIMTLRGVGQATALKIRKKAIKYCLMNDIDIMGIRTPTIAVLEVTRLDIQYYYDKLVLETRAKEVIKNASLSR